MIFWIFVLSPFLVSCILLSDLPTMKKPRSHTSSQAQWKPSDTLHYIMLVPIKADTICCQSMVIPCRKVTYPCNTRCPGGLSVFGYILCCYKIHTVRQRSKGWTSEALPAWTCVWHMFSSIKLEKLVICHTIKLALGNSGWNAFIIFFYYFMS